MDNAKVQIAVAKLARGALRRGANPLPSSLQRKVPLGVLLGGLLPGVGLAYAAPWPVVVLATAGVVLGYKVLAFVSFFVLAVPFLLVAAVASAVAGGLYAYRYNQSGRRSNLLGEDDAGSRKIGVRVRE